MTKAPIPDIASLRRLEARLRRFGHEQEAAQVVVLIEKSKRDHGITEIARTKDPTGRNVRRADTEEIAAQEALYRQRQQERIEREIANMPGVTKGDDS